MYVLREVINTFTLSHFIRIVGLVALYKLLLDFKEVSINDNIITFFIQIYKISIISAV